MTTDNSQTQDAAAPARPPRVLVGALFAGFLVIAVASFLPHLQLWGLNHLAFFPLVGRIAALALIALTFLPGYARTLYDMLIGFSQRIKRGGRGVDVGIAVVAVAAVAIFIGFRASTNLLGDGQLISQSFDAAYEGNKEVVMRSAEAIAKEEYIAPGATMAYYGATKISTGWLGKAPAWGIRVFNAVLGGLFVFFFLRMLRRGPFSPDIRLWLLILVIFSSTMELFFGYIENYSLMVFFLFFYVVAGFRVLHGTGRLWVPIVLFILAFYTHIQSFLFLPSLLFVILWRAMKSHRDFIEQRGALVLCVLTVLGTLGAALFTPLKKYLLSLRATDEAYGLLSLTHLADIANEIFMLMPALPLFLVMAWLVRRDRDEDAKKKGQTGGTAWFTLPREWGYSWLLLLPSLVYLVSFKPEIGMARDWDLFSMTSLGLIPLVLLVLNRFLRSRGEGTDRAIFTTPALMITVVLAVSWFGVNASWSRSTTRFERILEYDKTHASYAYENLSIFYYDKGMIDRAIDLMETCVEISHNPRQYVRLGMYYDAAGQTDKAIQLMYEQLEKRPKYGKARFLLVTLLEKTKRYPELLKVAKEGTVYFPKEAVYWFYLGEMSIALGRVDEGLEAFRKCRLLNPPPAAKQRIEEQLKKYSSGGE